MAKANRYSEIEKKKKAIALQRREAEEKKKKITVITVSVIVGVLLVAGIVLGVNALSNKKPDRTNFKIEYVEADPSLTYYADIDIKNYGVITVKLDQTAAPITVSNFISVAQSGWYDGLTLHRIWENFMIQGGCPEGDGTGDTGKTIKGEFKANGYDNPIAHERGVISMARGGDNYNSASCQFFIVHQTSTHLDGDYAAFGKVIEGMDVVDKICTEVEPIPNMNGLVEEDEQPVIKSIKIRTE